MGKCVQCEDFFPPHFMIDMEEKEDPPQKCIYCHLDKKEVTMVDDETGREEKVSKKQAVERYKKFIKRLFQSKNIQDALSKQNTQNLKV